jgi:release factor glutamine methyltransferase
MRPAEVVRRGGNYLARHGVEAPEVNAERLMLALLDVDRTAMLARDEGLTGDEARAYGRALCRRCTGTPLQHITGTEGFRRLVLAVRPGVFVPRPETEVVVEVALETIGGLDAPVVADACTGSGAVALAIADEHPGARVVATDLSPQAAGLARDNARALGLTVEVVVGDLLEPVAGPLDLVTCNPPYVPVERRDILPPEVLADPGLALFGGPPIYERLFAQAAERLRSGGHVVAEIEDSTGREISALAEDAGFTGVRIVADLSGRDRVVTGRRP